MKVLITGAPGWMGSLLAETLVKDGREVRCLVQPHADTSSLGAMDAEIATGDVTDPDSLKKACAGTDTIFHCAGIIHPRRVEQFYKINTYGTKNLAEAAIEAGVKKFIYVSSNVAGLGDHWTHNVSESDAQMPFMHYGSSKLRAENILMEYYKNGLIKIVIIRPNWLYGIKGPDRQLRFIKMIKRGDPIYFNSRSSAHSLCDIRNCIQALLLAERTEKAVGQKYYIADNRPYSILEAYQIIADRLGIAISPRHVCDFSYGSLSYKLVNRIMQGVRFYYPEIHMAWEWSKNLVCSIDKAKEDLGYSPLIDFNTGISDAIDLYLKNNLAL
jgi:nucleoside-diphosphate-sugar epimerase